MTKRKDNKVAVIRRIFKWLQFKEKSIAITKNAIAVRSTFGDNQRPVIVRRIKGGNIQVLGDAGDSVTVQALIKLSGWLLNGADVATALRFSRKLKAKVQ